MLFFKRSRNKSQGKVYSSPFSPVTFRKKGEKFGAFGEYLAFSFFKKNTFLLPLLIKTHSDYMVSECAHSDYRITASFIYWIVMLCSVLQTVQMSFS